jgi:hypothetical protein
MSVLPEDRAPLAALHSQNAMVLRLGRDVNDGQRRRLIMRNLLRRRGHHLCLPKPARCDGVLPRFQRAGASRPLGCSDLCAGAVTGGGLLAMLRQSIDGAKRPRFFHCRSCVVAFQTQCGRQGLTLREPIAQGASEPSPRCKGPTRFASGLARMESLCRDKPLGQGGAKSGTSDTPSPRSTSSSAIGARTIFRRRTRSWLDGLTFG